MKYLTLYIVAIFLVSCSEKPEETHDHTHEHDTHQDDHHDHTESLDPVSWGMVEDLSVKKFLYSNGQIDVPPQNRADLTTPFGGFVKEVTFYEGDAVKKGQLLIVLEDPKYIQIQEDYLSALNQYQFLKQDLDRKKTLLKGNAASEKEYQKTLTDERVWGVKVNAFKATLKMANISPERVEKNGIQETIKVLAPISGNIGHTQVNLGKYVEPGTSLAEIINDEHLHIELEVFAKDLGAIFKEQPIEYRLSGDDHWYDAKITQISRHVNDAKRTIKVHAHLSDSVPKIVRPGMLVEARITKNTKPTKVLPLDALVSEAGKYYVFTKSDHGIEKVEIAIGEIGDINFEVLTNLNDSVAVQGVYYLKAQFGGLEGGHSH